MDFYVEFGGGLGDIFYQIYQNGSYGALSDLGPEDRVTVVLITHNPHARELFDFHPKIEQIEVKYVGYWLSGQDEEMRRQHELVPTGPLLSANQKTVEFHPSPDDGPVLELLAARKYIVFSVSAGLNERDIPAHIVADLIQEARSRHLLPVFLGRNYDRHGRHEYRPPGNVALDLIDKLTVPGVAKAVQGAMGVVCCHSSINILAWLQRKPQLLLYPKAVYDTHIARRDQWAFGIDFPECRHGRFDEPGLQATATEFFDEMSRQA